MLKLIGIISPNLNVLKIEMVKQFIFTVLIYVQFYLIIAIQS